MPLVIAIDGPAAAGKGTLGRRLAEYFSVPYLDTGLLYRAVARRMLDRGCDLTDHAAARVVAERVGCADFARHDLRTPEVDRAASVVAAIPEVRAALLAFQRDFARAHGAVVDGRDIGTVILPDATLKFFVTAEVATRAARRLKERQGHGEAADLAAVTAEIEQRDAEDRRRPMAPLRQAADAILIDTTELDAEATLARALSIASARLGAKA